MSGKNLLLVAGGKRFGVKVVWKVAGAGESLLLAPSLGEAIHTCLGLEPAIQQFNYLFAAGTTLQLMDCEESIKPTEVDLPSNPPCDSATVVLGVSPDQGECKQLPTGERWYSEMLPAPDTAKEDLEALGLALAARSARVSRHSQSIPDDSIPHVMMDESKRLKIFVESGSCADQRLAMAKLFPGGRKMILHRCKDSDGFFF